MALLIVAVLVALVAPLSPAAATDDEDPIYLSLGMSYAAGTMADSTGDDIPFTNLSYTDQLFLRAKGRVSPRLEHVKLACPGETVLTFEFGGMCDGVVFDRYDSPQLSEALDVLATGNVALITISLGVNDLVAAIPALLACGPDLACIDGVVEPIALGVKGAVATVQAAAPGVPIVAMNFPNPFLATWLGFFPGVPAGLTPPDPGFAVLNNLVVGMFNDKLAAKFAELGIPMADVSGAFNSSDFGDSDGDTIPNNVEVICKLTFMCPDVGVKPNLHANKQGYELIAKTFFAIVKGIDFDD
jgi:lysophospholipase L1-like esterase